MTDDAIKALCTAAGAVLGGLAKTAFDYLKFSAGGQHRLRVSEAQFLRSQLLELQAEVRQLRQEVLEARNELAVAKSQLAVALNDLDHLRRENDRLRERGPGNGAPLA